MTAKLCSRHQDVEERDSEPLVIYVVQHVNNDRLSL
jgi:hypothetical protein